MEPKKFLPTVLQKQTKFEENNDSKIISPRLSKTTIYQPSQTCTSKLSLNKNIKYKTNHSAEKIGITDLSIAGIVPISTVDWPEKLSCVLFLQGCPWKCVYCHNYEILDSKTPGKIPFKTVMNLLEKRKGLLDAVVFSGGEATRQEALIPAMQKVKEMGFKVGLHTAGAYPKKLARLIEFGLADWIGIDIKALAEHYKEIVGVANAGGKAYESLKIVLNSGVDYEVRLTVFPNSVTSFYAYEVAKNCFDMGVKKFALQQARQEGAPDGFVADFENWCEDFSLLAEKISSLGFDLFESRAM